MKKIMLLVLPVIILLSGCVKKQIKFINREQIYKANVSYKGEHFVCNIKSGQTVTVELMSPKKLKGLKYVCNDKGISVEYNNINYKDSIKSQSRTFASVINAVFLNADNTVGSLSNGEYVFNTNAGKEKATLYCNKSGIPIRIICEKERLNVALKAN